MEHVDRYHDETGETNTATSGRNHHLFKKFVKKLIFMSYICPITFFLTTFQPSDAF